MKRPVKVSARQLSRLIKEATMSSDTRLDALYDELANIATRLKSARDHDVLPDDDAEFDRLTDICQQMNVITALIDRNADMGPEHVRSSPRLQR